MSSPLRTQEGAYGDTMHDAVGDGVLELRVFGLLSVVALLSALIAVTTLLCKMIDRLHAEKVHRELQIEDEARLRARLSDPVHANGTAVRYSAFRHLRPPRHHHLPEKLPQSV